MWKHRFCFGIPGAETEIVPGSQAYLLLWPSFKLFRLLHFPRGFCWGVKTLLISSSWSFPEFLIYLSWQIFCLSGFDSVCLILSTSPFQPPISPCLYLNVFLWFVWGQISIGLSLPSYLLNFLLIYLFCKQGTLVEMLLFFNYRW